MIEFDPVLYVSPGLKDQKVEICEKLMCRETVTGIYIIYLNLSTGLPEAIPSLQIGQKYYEEHRTHVVGLAESYELTLNYLANAARERYGL
ncbi:hypothetical protein SAMN02910370_02219 [Lachnospiraceae bacterium XPB1003]|nr:hypothetical protein SAMN02910370_02219 [Lachnospiraceae bacterium XPB1003]